MKTNWSFQLLLIITTLLFTACKEKQEDNTGYPHTLKFITEEYPPLNFTDEGRLTGLGTELLYLVCDELNIPSEIKVLNWDEAYEQALETYDAVLFSTVLNSSRKNEFQWAGPYASIDWGFYSASGSSIALTSMSDAKNVDAIGVMVNDAMEQYLLEQGFANLVYCTNATDGFDRLLNGTIDLFPASKIMAEHTLSGMGHSPFEVINKLTIKTDLVYFAFNKEISAEVVNDFQEAIDHFKSNGTLDALYARFMESNHAPEIMQFYTEDYSPLTFRNTFGEISGFGTDIVRDIMRRNQTYYDISLSLWSNGYELALNNPNFCLFTMDRTEIRENLFQWVGPIGTNTTYFFTLASSGIIINTFEEAKNLSAIGTVSAWFSDQYLREDGFANLVASGDPATMVNLLFTGQVDAAVCSDITFPDIIEAAGYSYADVIPTIGFLSSDFYIAFSLSTPSFTVDLWQETLEAAITDGTYNEIYQRWFPRKYGMNCLP